MNTVSRRILLLSGLSAAAVGGLPRSGSATQAPLQFGPPFKFGYELLVDRARGMAGSAFQPVVPVAPAVIERIDYEAHGKLRFRTDAALFREGPGAYPVTFFHVGRYFPRGVRLHVLRDGWASEVRYAPELFEMPDDSPARELPGDIGFAGFRFQEARTRADWRTQDWLAFLGASYWRAIGDMGQYGLSARGIAIDSATPKPEEFPEFREFYLVPGARDRDPPTILALLDGPSVTGAFRMLVRRDRGVSIDVEARLFHRRDVERLGIAPITSMFWYGENTVGIGDDWRPEIHDSDGLAIWTGQGERIWRPLVNPRFPSVSSFLDENPRGFGLMQRDRDFENYLDGVRYERRPSLWIEPLDGWGRGAVQLMELRTDDEVHDNIGAFWVPEAPARAGMSHTFRYRQHWRADTPVPSETAAQCLSTRLGRGGQPGQHRPQGVRKFVVEFAGPSLERLRGEAAVEAVVGTSSGSVANPFAERVPGTGRWRLQFDLAVEGEAPAELRAFLRSEGTALTETWLYRYDPLPRG